MIYLLLIISAVAVVGFSMWYAKKVDKDQLLSKDKQVDRNGSEIEDKPLGFGYKTTWLAVRASDPKHVASVLALNEVEKCNWKIGIEIAYEMGKYVFVTPVIDGWVLVVGFALPSGDSDESVERLQSLLEKLSSEFGEAQLFSTHRVVEFHSWAKAINGKVERIYSYIGESGENIFVSGTPTAIERKYKLVNTLSNEAEEENYFERNDLTYPDEELVMTIAGAWSVNPTMLEEYSEISGMGLSGKFKL